MQRLSLRVIFCVLLMSAVLLPVQVVNQAFAQPGITIGFAVDGSGLIVSSTLADELGAYLEQQLSMPVRVRSFTTEKFLYDWLVRYREVDFAWVSKTLQDAEPEGEFFPLAENLDHVHNLFKGSVVARQGQKITLLQQVSAVFLSMHENPEGRALLQKLEISRFVATSLWQTPEWAGAVKVQSNQSYPQEDNGSLALPMQSEAPGSKQAPEALASSDARVEMEGPEKVAFPDPKQAPAALDAAKSEVPETLPEKTELLPVPLLAKPADASVQEVAETGLPANVDSQEMHGIDNSHDALDGTARMTGSDVGEMEASTVPGSAPGEESPIALVADSLTYNSAEDSYEATGDVVLRQAEVELKSDSLLWQASTQDAAAEGSVELEDAGTKVLGKSMQYNMATRQGQIRDGRLFVREGNFHLAGEQIEKTSQSDYFVKEGSFTTCDGEIPDWNFSADQIDVTVGGYARAKHVWFHIYDIPVLYTPYLTFPVKTERESGMLAPTVGYSNNKGLLTSLAWYQVIDRNMDATIYLDYLSKIGLGKGLEYRYVLSGQNSGEALYYHVSGTGDLESQGEKSDFPDLDYYKWQHSGKLPADWRLMADIEYTDEKLFFEEFGKLAEDYNRDKTVSTLMLSRNWQKLNMVGYARYIKDLESNNDTTLQRLPELGVGLSRHRLGDTPVYLGLESYATRFWRNEGEDGDRLYLKPSLSAAFKPGGWLEILPEIALHEHLYDADSGDEESFVPEFSLLMATRLLKSFDVNFWDVERLQHSVEPQVTYTYVPDENQDDLPLFDLSDRIQSRNDITYALVNRLTARSTAADGSLVYRELLNLRLSQSYALDEDKDLLTGKAQPFSDIRVELDLWPTQYFSLNLDSLIPVYGGPQFRTLSLGMAANDGTGNAAAVNYTYNNEEFSNSATDYIDLQVQTPVLRPVYALFEERYDFRQARELERVVGLEYRSQCWSLFLTYKNRYQESGDDDQEVMFTFVLSGLGQNTGFGM